MPGIPGRTKLGAGMIGRQIADEIIDIHKSVMNILKTCMMSIS